MSRKKTVFRSDELAHVWASQSQLEGRNPQNNFYFDGRTIYSYGSHYRAAAFVSLAPRIVLVNSRRYSVTTGGQLYAIRRALHASDIVFHVPVVRENPTRDDHRQNLAHYFGQLPDLIARQRKARINDYRATIVDLIRTAGEYAAALKCRALLTKRQRALIAAAADCTTSAAHAAGESFDSRLSATIAIVANWSAAEVDAQALARQRSENARRRAADRAAAEETKRGQLLAGARGHAIDLWRKGAALSQRFAANASQWLSIGDCMPRHALLRLSADGAEVETSQGASVPIADALRAWPLLKDKRAPQFDIGHYKPAEVARGNFRIGCHLIPLAEVETIAAQLGLN